MTGFPNVATEFVPRMSEVASKHLASLFVAFLFLTLIGNSTMAEDASASQEYLPRIAVKVGHFIVKTTGREFHPFGFHYIRLRPDGAHYVFAPGLYDASRVEAMLADLRKNGANIVRVFFGSIGVADANGLNPAFVSNLCDFLERATRHHVYVLPVVDWIPSVGPYNALLSHGQTEVGGMQSLYLCKDRLAAKARYLTDVIRAIRRHNPHLLSTVFAYELENEACFEINAAPFTKGTESFAFAGKSYAMSDQNQVQALMDDAAHRWTRELVNAIHGEDPDAMVSTSVFTYAAVGRTGPASTHSDSSQDNRVPMRPLALASTPLSYVDVHLYAASPDGVARDLKSIEWDKLKEACRETGKPLLVGEFGTFRSVHATAAAAAYAMGWQLRKIAELGFTGAIYWTYDCEEQTPLWNAKTADGAILKALVEARGEVWGSAGPRPKK